MRIRKTVNYLLRFITIGLAAAIAVIYFYPSFQNDIESVILPGGKVIEIKLAAEDEPLLPDSITSYADPVASAAPAVVNIYTQTLIAERANPWLDDPLLHRFLGPNHPQRRQRIESSLGSGVIISSNGYILTNNHVISGADRIEVALSDGRSTTAKIIGSDPDTDLAVLKIDMDKLPAIVLGHSKRLRVGDIVLAIGNPFGVGQTVTSGIVSATGRNRLGINTYENFIQTDAAINPGNSGGALITANGNLVGINSLIFSRSGGSQGIGFAIPIDLARDVMQQIIEHGHVVRGWLGIAIQDLDEDLAHSFGLDSTDGFIITSVVRHGPADEAGLEAGDVITRINGKAVKDVVMALTDISRIKPGEEARLDGIREGQAFTATATVVQRPVGEDK